MSLNLLAFVALVAGAQPKDASLALSSPAGLADAHRRQRFLATAAPCLTPDAVREAIGRLVERYPGVTSSEQVGASFRGRPIRMLSIGSGRRSLLLWSQMHGDEPSATPATLDLVDFLARERARPEIAAVLGAFSLRVIPMLNPDGAESYQRRNAQGIDINRDALMLATPEGRALKAVRDRFEPILGFNLHDQDRRTMVGDTATRTTISLLAVAGDEKGTMTPGRERAKRVSSRIVRALEPLIPGAIARYDEDWSPRAFGDNLTRWGTPVVLIESAAFPPGGAFEDLTRLNFVALVSALVGLASNDLADETAERYDRLLRNRADAWADVAIEGASILDGATLQEYRANVAFNVFSSDRGVAGCATRPESGDSIVELGDTSQLTAGRRLDGSRALIVGVAETPTGPLGPDAIGALPGDALPEAFRRFARLRGIPLSRGRPASFVALVREADGAERLVGVRGLLGLDHLAPGGGRGSQ